MLKLTLICLGVALAHASLLGGWSMVDPTDSDVTELMSFLETSINARSNSMMYSKATTVLHVQRQLVNGMNYRIKFDLEPTTCMKSAAQDLTACGVDDKSQGQECKATVYEDFQKARTLNDFRCIPKPQMTKRAGQMQTVDDPSTLSVFAIRAMAMSNANLKNVRVVSATMQVVAGQMIKMKVLADGDVKDVPCEIDVWSRPWLKNDEGFKVTKFSCGNMVARELLGGITGGISNDLDDKDQYLMTAKKALTMTNSALENLKVIRARTQTVAGQNIYLTVLGTEFGKQKQCDMTIWSRPWVPEPEGFKLTHFSCSEIKSKRSCAGCVSDEVTDLDNPAYMSLYIRAFGLAKTNMDINNIQILSVRKQVVAGIKYMMKVKTSEAGQPRLCDVSFVEAAWMTPSISNVKFNCKPTQ